jgi:hypothetical protein
MQRRKRFFHFSLFSHPKTGGFGTLLKQEGRRRSAKKTTNFESSRDLQGRRLRTVNEAKQLADWIEQGPERKRQEIKDLEERIKEAEKKTRVITIKKDVSGVLKEQELISQAMDTAIEKGINNSNFDTIALKRAPKVKPIPNKKKKKVVTMAWKDSDSESS